MPTDDKDVQAALFSLCAIFKRTRKDASVVERADLLAGLALLHTHHHDLASLVAVLTIAQQQTLATALGLDFQAHCTVASWPVLLARHIVTLQATGQTPKKRKPARDCLGGQIRKPSDSGAPSDSTDANCQQGSAANQEAQDFEEVQARVQLGLRVFGGGELRQRGGLGVPRPRCGGAHAR